MQASAFLLKNDAVLIIMSLILLAGVLSLLYGVYRTYKGFSYLSRYVPYAGLGKAGAVLYLIPPLIPVGNILLGISLFFVGSKYKSVKLKVGGIMTAIPFPLLGLVIEVPIGLLPLIIFIVLSATIIGLRLAYYEGHLILKKYYSYVSYEKTGPSEPEAHSELSVDFG
jgi:phosphatidylglycerophosphate synthase